MLAAYHMWTQTLKLPYFLFLVCLFVRSFFCSFGLLWVFFFFRSFVCFVVVGLFFCLFFFCLFVCLFVCLWFFSLPACLLVCQQHCYCYFIVFNATWHRSLPHNHSELPSRVPSFTKCVGSHEYPIFTFTSVPL